MVADIQLYGGVPLINGAGNPVADLRCCCVDQGSPGSCRKFTYTVPTTGACGTGAFNAVAWDGSSTFSVTAPSSVDMTLTSAAGDFQYADISCGAPTGDRHCCNWLDATLSLSYSATNCGWSTGYPFCTCAGLDTSFINLARVFFSPDYYWLAQVCLFFNSGGANVWRGWQTYKSTQPLLKDPTNTYWISAGTFPMAALDSLWEKSTNGGATYAANAAPCVLGAAPIVEVTP